MAGNVFFFIIIMVFIIIVVIVVLTPSPARKKERKKKHFNISRMTGHIKCQFGNPLPTPPMFGVGIGRVADGNKWVGREQSYLSGVRPRSINTLKKTKKRKVNYPKEEKCRCAKMRGVLLFFPARSF